MYRHVDVLNANGIPAVVLHHEVGFRCTWFANQTAVTYPPDAWPPKRSEVLLIPELFIWQFVGQAPDTPKVVFNQNAYQTFRGQSIAHQVSPYGMPDCVGSIVVSEDSRQYLEFAFPAHRVFRIHNSIDPSVFHLPTDGRKSRLIALMPRKSSHDAAQVLNLLRGRANLRGFEFAVIQGKSEAETAQALRDSMVFLSFSTQEGCPMPPLEAMACGCLTVGYDGRGGREYFDDRHAIVVEQQDVIGFTAAVEQTIARLDKEDVALGEMVRAASQFVSSTYTPQREEQDIVGAWRDILAQI
jgi:glycosyltransferase involved in cell wall biosynthesis